MRKEALDFCDRIESQLEKFFETKDFKELGAVSAEVSLFRKKLESQTNERGAGRKLKGVSAGRIVVLKRAGKTYRDIANELDISVGLAHKIYKEQSEFYTDEYIEEYKEEFMY